MTPDVTIDFDGKKLIVTPPSWLIGRAKAVPDRRWLEERRSWAIPVTPVNLGHLDRIYPGARMTDAAHRAVGDMAAKIAEREKNISQRLPFPANYPFKREPMPHQLRGLDTIYGLECSAIFSETRTRKTKIAIDSFTMRYFNNDIQQVLVFCPNSVIPNWVREIGYDCPAPYEPAMLDLGRHKEITRWIERPQAVMRWLVASWESLSAVGDRALGMVKAFAQVSTTAVIGDESHKIKNHKALRTKRAYEVSELCPRRIIITGTEITRDILDLYSQLFFLDPALLPVSSYYVYRNHFTVLGGYGEKEVIGFDHVEELTAVISTVAFQVKRKDIEKDLPEDDEKRHYVEMTPEQWKHYNRLLADVDAEEGDLINILTKSLRMHQIAGGFVAEEHPAPPGSKKKVQIVERWISDAKIKELLETIEGLQGAIVVWARYTIEIDHIVAAIEKNYGPCGRLDGANTREERDAIRERFQAGEFRFVAGSAAAGGIGVDLAAADTEIFYSTSHDYGDRKQAEDRIKSLERKKSALYIDSVARGTVDLSILTAHGRKQSLAEYVKEAIRLGKNWHAEEEI